MCAQVGRFVARGFRRRDGVQKRVAFFDDGFGNGVECAQFLGHLFKATAEFGHLLGRILAALLPASTVFVDRGKALRARFRIAAQAFDMRASACILRARLCRFAARERHGFGQGNAIAQIGERFNGLTMRILGRIARLRKSANFGFKCGKLRDAFGCGARGFGSCALRADQRLGGAAIFLFRHIGGFASSCSRIACSGIKLKQRRALFLGGREFAFEFDKPVALRQPDRARRFRFRGGRITIPTPQIAAWRNQPLARMQRKLQRRSLIGKDNACRIEQAGKRGGRLHEILQRLRAIGQRVKRGQRPQIAPMMRCGFIERRLQIIAQSGGERAFVARLHTHRVHKRRP